MFSPVRVCGPGGCATGRCCPWCRAEWAWASPRTSCTRSVAAQGAVGTIASVDLRHHHPDLMRRSHGVRDRTALDRLNLEALDREVKAAKALSGGRGAIAVNVMKAVDQNVEYWCVRPANPGLTRS